MATPAAALSRVDRIARRNDKIRKAYETARAERKHTSAHILDMLSEKYDLSPRTLERILWGKDAR